MNPLLFATTFNIQYEGRGGGQMSVAIEGEVKAWIT
jgi:hypothetical protein